MIPHIPVHNYTRQYNGFYTSYNPVDIESYGCATTALVTNDMQHFLILNGNHMEAYADIAEQGLEECLNYFAANKQAHSKFSDPINAMVVIDENGRACYARGSWGYVGGEYKFTLDEDDA